MASFNKINSFAFNLGAGRHVFGTNVHNVVLSTTSPGNNNNVIGDITQITAASGYSANGANAALAIAQAVNVANITGTNVVFTASGNNLGNATSNVRYATLFNTISPYNLVGWWDYGSAITVADTETFTIAWGATVMTITI